MEYRKSIIYITIVLLTTIYCISTCPINCQSCSISNSCIKCKQTYILQNNICKYYITQPKQSNPQFHNILSTQIKPSSLTHINNNKNQIHKANLNINTNTIVNKFISQGHIGNQKCILQWQGLCILCGYQYQMGHGGICIDRFDKCIQIQQLLCIKCNHKFVLRDGQCIDIGCNILNYYGCTQCKPGYILNKYKICQIQNCISYNNSQCIGCVQGYQLFNNTCIKCKQQQYIDINGKCVHKQVKYLIKTKQQQKQQIKQTNQINQQQIKQQQQHQIKLPQNCLQFTCKYCQTGYLSMNGKCNKLLNCKNITGNICYICQNGYSLTIFGTCFKSIDNCLQYNTIACIRCPANYILTNSLQNTTLCIFNTTYIDPNCNTLNYNNKCTSCKSSYRLQPKYNYLCMQIKGKRCKTSDPTNSKCLSCFQGYKINILIGDCIKVMPLMNCINQVQGKCQKCAIRYYLSEQKCKQVDPLCKQYEKDKGYCLSCYEGYLLTNNMCKSIINVIQANPTIIQNTNQQQQLSQQKQSGIKIYVGVNPNISNCRTAQQPNTTNNTQKKRCLACYSGHYLDKKTGTCIRNDPMCKTHNGNGSCLSCFQGYQIIGKVCQPRIINSHFTYYANCKKVDQNKHQCLQCIDRYVKKGAICRPVSVQCNIYNKITGQCINCYPGYTLKSGNCLNQNIQLPQYCQQIDINSLIDPSLPPKCIKCSQGYYLNKDKDKCQKISILCIKATQTGQCITCIQGYFKNKYNICIKAALGWDFNCQQYDDQQGYCISCKTGYLLENYLCIKVQHKE